MRRFVFAKRTMPVEKGNVIKLRKESKIMNAKRCDRCGKYYTLEVPIQYRKYSITKNLRNLGAGALDLCKDCQEKLNIFVEEARK